MRVLMKIFLALLVLLVVAVAVVLVRYPYLMQGIKKVYLKGHMTSDISDFKRYPYREIPKGRTREWPLHKDYNRIPASQRLLDAHREYETAAYLVIKDDSLLFEQYYNGFRRDSLTNSFSMAKSITMLLVAKAIEDGYIKSLDQKVKDFIPEIQGPYADSVRIRHLATMSAGTDWDENYYSPFSITAESYFSKDLDKLMIKEVRFVYPPGERWFYSSGDTQFLGMIVRRATGKDLAAYLSESFWKPMGMRREAYWNTDRDGGMEKAFCCINACARDFARFGRLMLHEGNWDGRQLVDSALVREMTRAPWPDVPYGMQWWLFEHNGVRGYTMRGHLGQYVMVIPAEHTVIVRTGRRKAFSRPGTYAQDFFIYLEEGLKIARQAR